IHASITTVRAQFQRLAKLSDSFRELSLGIERESKRDGNYRGSVIELVGSPKVLRSFIHSAQIPGEIATVCHVCPGIVWTKLDRSFDLGLRSRPIIAAGHYPRQSGVALALFRSQLHQLSSAFLLQFKPLLPAPADQGEARNLKQRHVSRYELWVGFDRVIEI